MESILGVVTLIIIFIVKAALSSKGTDAEPQVGEAFPSIKPLEPKEENSVLVVEPAPNHLLKNVETSAVAREEGARVVRHVRTQPVVQENHERTGKMSLNGKSEVRKAFIYSEIFKRKY